MGADMKPRHKRFGLVFDAIIFWWHFSTSVNADLLSVPERIPIGALFPHGGNYMQTVFKQAIHQHNSNASLKFIVETATEFVDHNDPTRVVRQLQCLHFNRGIYAFLAPQFGAFAYKSALSFSNTYRVPLIGSSPLFPTHERSYNEYTEFYGINLEPNYWPAIISVLKWYQWNKIIYIYDSDYGIFNLQEMLKHSHRSDHNLQLTTIKRIRNAGDGYKLLKSLDREKKDSMKCVILDCDIHISKALISYHIQDTAMEKTKFHYILTNLMLNDSWSKEVPAAFNAVNITSFALPADKTELKKLTQIKRSLVDFREDETPSLEETLAFDGTKVLLEAFNLIIQSQINISKALESESVISTVNFTRKVIDPTCPSLKPFKFGEIIANHLKITTTQGITGNIEFHNSGLRKNYTIEIFEISNNGLFEKIALWSDLVGLNVLHPNRLRINDRSTLFNQNMTYTVTTILEEPFLMLKKGDQQFIGNDRFEGYLKDFVDLLAKNLDFNYKIRLVNDSKYGATDDSGVWSGMIGELMRNEVDMAIAPLTITLSRLRVVDFTQPFLTSGISIMMKKPTVVTPDIFAFIKPLTKEVWASIIIALFAVTLIFYLVSKLSFERDISENANQSNKKISLCASLCYSFGVLVYQVSGVYPHTASSRIVSSVWWLFVFMTITTYLANLTAQSVTNRMRFTLFNIFGNYDSSSDAFLYYDQMLVPINSVEDLLKQNVLEFGVLKHSSTQAFFRTSKVPTYAKMWDKMQLMNDVFVDSYSEGINKVRESDGRYVFILETAMNDYISDREPCNTFKVGKNLHDIEYGIALPLGSPIREPLNRAIITLKENGDLANLKNKWWNQRSQCKLIDIKELSNTNIATNNILIGLFILTIGLILALIVAIIEHFCNKKVSYRTNYTITKQEEILEEEENSSKRRNIKD